MKKQINNKILIAIALIALALAALSGYKSLTKPIGEVPQVPPVVVDEHSTSTQEVPTPSKATTTATKPEQIPAATSTVVVALPDLPLASLENAKISQVITLINQERAKNGLNALVEYGRLDKAAQDKADDMVANRYFSHTDPNNASSTSWRWFHDAEYTYKYAGENLSVNWLTPEEAVAAWVASPAHYANITNSHYTETGIGISQLKGDYNFTVEERIAPAGTSTQPTIVYKVERLHDPYFIVEMFGSR